MKWTEYIEYWGYKSLEIFFSSIPRNIGKIIIYISVYIIKTILRRRQLLMIKNLKFTFPQKTSKEIVKLATQVWYNIGLTFLDVLVYTTKPTKLKKIFKGYDTVKKLLPKQNQGLIIFSGHIGNWELLMQRIILDGYKSAAIARKLRNQKVNLAVNRLREFWGGKILEAHEVNKAFKLLKQGWIVYLLPDQHIIEGIKTTFLGRQAYTSPLIVLLSKRTNCKILPLFCIRDKDDKYKFFVEDEFIPLQMKNLKETLQINTERINKIIEKYIKLYPEQWLWLHNRWR